MKTKLEMAHDYFIALVSIGAPAKVYNVWDYADKMQAEADKRNYPEKQDSSEWQPDWSQAPDWANWWAMDKNKQGIWHNKIPCNKQSTHEWVIDFSAGSDFSYKVSPDFDYKGDWKDSLRRRP